MSHHPSVVVSPCSGIGKAFGTVSREAAYELCENFRPADTNLVALSKLVSARRTHKLESVAIRRSRSTAAN
jgi:hypothetical protein